LDVRRGRIEIQRRYLHLIRGARGIDRGAFRDRALKSIHGAHEAIDVNTCERGLGAPSDHRLIGVRGCGGRHGCRRGRGCQRLAEARDRRELRPVETRGVDHRDAPLHDQIGRGSENPDGGKGHRQPPRDAHGKDVGETVAHAPPRAF